ncbi:MarR family winged helix-turn-helix transcriptional regulator [Bacillus smithii]|mgnify:FL=1|jgi:DNA-binding MarR family transcriptional regulator
MGLTSKTDKIAESFIRLLPLIYNKMNKPVANQKAAPKTSDLTHLQFHILEELFHTKEGISMTQLAQNINISKQQLTPLIAKLAENNYVEKAKNDRDRRFVKLMLTEKGKETVKKRWEDFYYLFCEKIGQLDEEDLIDFDYAIHKIIRILEKLD